MQNTLKDILKNLIICHYHGGEGGQLYFMCNYLVIYVHKTNDFSVWCNIQTDSAQLQIAQLLFWIIFNQASNLQNLETFPHKKLKIL